jgi:hypothetical protein
VLYEVTGHRLTLAFAVGETKDEGEGEEQTERPTSEEEFVSLLKDRFDARELE